jgi:DNA-binding SARP family transcriptional activator
MLTSWSCGRNEPTIAAVRKQSANGPQLSVGFLPQYARRTMLRVRVLGPLELEVGGRAVAVPTGRPPRSLLAWLALHPGTHPRAAVAAALWPDVLDTSARASLRTALTVVRRSVGDGPLAATRERVGLAEDVWVDAREFDALLDAGKPEAALELARGELLPDLDDDWVLRARDRHRERWSAALAAVAAATADPATALAWARRRAELDPFDEAAHRDLMAALADSGEPAAALAVYERLRLRLRRELGLAPSTTTRDLASSLRTGGAEVGEQPPLPARLRPERWRTSFVGRDAALARLSAVWASLVHGGVGVALIVGEPGIGKSRLAARFAAELHAGGAAVLAGRAERELDQPYAPLVEALGVEVSELRGAPDPQAGRGRVHDALLEALDHAAAGRPLLLVLDDVHWADAATLAFLRHLTARGPAAPVLVLATSRPDRHAAFADAFEAALVELEGFSLGETEALLAGRADAGLLRARTGGNPFFLEALLDAGTTDELPAGVAELVTARVATLGEEVRSVLQAAAIIGREFEIELGAAVADRSLDETLAALDAAAAARLLLHPAGNHGRAAFVHALVQDALVQATQAGERARLHARALEALESRGSDEALVAAARHALAAAPLVPPERLAALAEAAAAVLTRGYAAVDAADLLARAIAQVPARAPRARLDCALGEALTQSDRPEAAREAFERVAAAARQLGEGALLARAALGLAGAGVTIIAVDRQRVALLTEALEVLDDGEVELRARLQSRLAIELAYDADRARRDRLAADAVATARSSRDPRATAAALGAQHVVLWGPDYTRERLELADEMLALARRAEDAVLELQARTWRIVDLDELGDRPALEAELDAYADVAARIGLSVYSWWVPAWRSARAYLAGRLADAARLQRRAGELGRRAGDRNAEFTYLLHWVIPLADERLEDLDLEWQRERIRSSPASWGYRSMYTWMLAALGEEAEARRELAAQRAEGAPHSWPRDMNWLTATKELSEAAVLLDDRELAAELAQLLEPFADRLAVAVRGLISYGSVAGALGRLAALAGDLGSAAARYRQAIEVEERAGAAIWATHHRLRLAETWLEIGDADGAKLIERVTAEAEGFGLDRLAERAAALATPAG